MIDFRTKLKKRFELASAQPATLKESEPVPQKLHSNEVQDKAASIVEEEKKELGSFNENDLEP